MTIENGSILRVNYTGFDSETKKMIDTTFEDKAKKNGLLQEGKQYGSIIIILGEKELMPGLEKAVETMTQGEKKMVSMNPEEAFGERNSQLINVVPLNEFKKIKMQPFPGLVIELNGQIGKVQTVSGGRVRVDFNHPLAGKKVEYEIEVEKVFSDDEKNLALVKKIFPKTTETEIKLKDKELLLKKDLEKDSNKEIIKTILEELLKKYGKNVEKVKIVKEFEKTEKQPKSEEKTTK